MEPQFILPHRGYSHYRNLAQSGCVFVTTTCLDFAQVFVRPELADIMTASLLDDCRHYGARLSGFVVMPHHIHLLLVLPDGMNVSRLVERIKSNSARRVGRRLDFDTRSKFDRQRGLNRRTFWQRSFRSVWIGTEPEWSVKLDYIHQNPVRAGLVDHAEDYRWSSMRFRLAGDYSDEAGLLISDPMIEGFCSKEILRLGITPCTSDAGD